MKMQDKTLLWSHTTSAVFALRWFPANSARGNGRGKTGTKLAGITGPRVTTGARGRMPGVGWGSNIRIHAETFAVRLLTTGCKKPAEAAKWKAGRTEIARQRGYGTKMTAKKRREGCGYAEWIKNDMFEGRENEREMRVRVKSGACYINDESRAISREWAILLNSLFLPRAFRTVRRYFSTIISY